MKVYYTYRKNNLYTLNPLGTADLRPPAVANFYPKNSNTKLIINNHNVL